MITLVSSLTGVSPKASSPWMLSQSHGEPKGATDYMWMMRRSQSRDWFCSRACRPM